MSSRISERRPVRSRHRSVGSSSSSTRSESSSTGASGAASRTACRAARTKARSSLTIAKPSPVLKSSFAIDSAERPPGSAWKPGGRKRDSFSRGTQLRTSSGRGADLAPQARVLRPITQDDATGQVTPELDRRRAGAGPGGGARLGGGSVAGTQLWTGKPASPRGPPGSWRRRGYHLINRCNRSSSGTCRAAPRSWRSCWAARATAYGSRFELWLVGDLINRGPDNLAVLRRVRELVDSGRARLVLGNHEIGLLLTAAGLRERKPLDSFGDVLEAPDAEDWLAWLRCQRLLETGQLGQQRFAMVHAAVHPAWSLAELERRVRRVEARLAGPARGHRAARRGPGAGSRIGICSGV